MSKWEKVKLGDICEILDSQRIPVTAANRKAGIYPYYGANGVQDYVNDYIFDDELVLLAEDGGNFGSKDRPIAYRVSGKCWVNNHAHILKPKAGLNVDYLCYSLMFYDVSDIVNGATRQKLNQAAMRKMQIPLPPLEEQKRIADILDKASNLIDLRKSQLEKMDLLIKSKFIDMFGDPITNYKGWGVKKLIEVTNKIGSGSTPRGGKGSYIEEGISLIRSMNVYDGRFKYDELAYIDLVQAKQMDIVTVFDSDVLINITGASVARSCVVPKNVLPARVNQHVSIVRCIYEIINPIYLNRLFISDSFKNVLLAVGGAGGATREAITKQQLEKLDIPIPPIELQTQFAAFVEQVEKQKAVMQQSFEKMETNYKALMQEYFG